MQPYKLHVLLIGYRYMHQMIKVWVYWNTNVIINVTVYVLLKQNHHVTSADLQNKRHNILITAKQQSL